MDWLVLGRTMAGYGCFYMDLAARRTGALLQALPSDRVAMSDQRYGATLEGSPGEDELAFHLKAAGIPFVRQFHFGAGWMPPRKFAADFAIADEGHSGLLVEVDGGVWVSGRHSRGDADYERAALALIHGWTVLRVSTGQVKSGKALDWIERLLAKGANP